MARDLGLDRLHYFLLVFLRGLTNPLFLGGSFALGSGADLRDFCIQLRQTSFDVAQTTSRVGAGGLRFLDALLNGWLCDREMLAEPSPSPTGKRPTQYRRS